LLAISLSFADEAWNDCSNYLPLVKRDYTDEEATVLYFDWARRANQYRNQKVGRAEVIDPLLKELVDLPNLPPSSLPRIEELLRDNQFFGAGVDLNRVHLRFLTGNHASLQSALAIRLVLAGDHRSGTIELALTGLHDLTVTPNTTTEAHRLQHALVKAVVEEGNKSDSDARLFTAVTMASELEILAVQESARVGLRVNKQEDLIKDPRPVLQEREPHPTLATSDQILMAWCLDPRSPMHGKSIDWVLSRLEKLNKSSVRIEDHEDIKSPLTLGLNPATTGILMGYLNPEVVPVSSRDPKRARRIRNILSRWGINPDRVTEIVP
jgi:hypothetical protein